MIQPSYTKRILHIDQHPVAQLGLHHALKSLPNIEIHPLRDSSEIDRSLLGSFDLIVTEIVSAPPSGVAIVRELEVAFRGTPILVLSSNDETIYADRCLKAGARGFICKTAPLPTLFEAVETTMSGDLWVSENVKSLMISRLVDPDQESDQPNFHHLSDRELLIVEQIALSKNNKEIAQALQISVKTIESHRSRIKTKLQLDTPQDLMRYALRIHNV